MFRSRPLERDPDKLAKRLRAMTRIRKLLRLAEDQAGKPEGRAALARAEEMMARHDLAKTTLDDVVLGKGDYRQRTFEVGREQAWRQTLVHAIADYFDCVALHRNGATEVETYGPEGALPQVEYTFVVYLRNLREAWKAHTHDLIEADIWRSLSKRQQVEAREAFCVSFVLGVKERLEKDRIREKDEDPAAWSDAREGRRALERWMRRGGVRWRTSPTGVGTFSDEGFKAGMRSEVNAAVMGSRGPKRLTGN